MWTGHLVLRRVSSIGKVQGRVVIIGSGWAGFKLLETIDQKNFDVVVISPRNYFLFTPLLASTCVGTLEFRSIIEPIRRQTKRSSTLKFFEATVSDIDLNCKKIHCLSVFDNDEQGKKFSISYDHAIIACGAVTNTFNIPGVAEYAYFLKDINDARKIRYKIMECFERSCQPGLSDEMQSNLLHFLIVGGGPTGVEFSAELHDFITEDLSRLYPLLMEKVQITLIDVAPKILSTFDMSLSDYTAKKFARKGIRIRTGTVVTQVLSDQAIVLKNGTTIHYGLLVWATGISPNPLVHSLAGSNKVAKCPRSGRLLTDAYCRVLNIQEQSPVQEGIYAIGDCASIKENDLPCTAQVAKQKAKYLGRLLNSFVHLRSVEQNAPFSYRDMGSMAYIGQWRAIAGLSLTKEKKWNESGILAWLLWRSAYFTMSVSVRNKILIPTYW